jgi:hypothetical protein
MARKPRIVYRLKEDGNSNECDLQGIGVGYQLTLAEMGGERNVKIHWFAQLPHIDMDAEMELALNIEAAQSLVSRLQSFLTANLPLQREDYQ